MAYNRRLNIRVVGLAENTEPGQPVEFFVPWLPRVLKMTTKASRIKLERAHHTLAPSTLCLDDNFAEHVALFVPFGTPFPLQP